MDGTIGEIRLFAASFAPKNWAYCSGSLVAIRSNTALFSILGTVYGGDGVQTFGLPDLRSRAALGAGQAPGLSYYALGEMTGTNSTTLLSSNLAPHTHAVSAHIAVPAFSDTGNASTPSGNVPASANNMYSAEHDSNMAPVHFTATIGIAGGQQPVNIQQPMIGMNYIVCMYGVFPSRG